ncbi:M23 family metallopeptidase [Stenotrophomonas sp. 24(2023)]|uniref:M23 family metallopeptidase n=1 Tax=Stenotrophomonas sp. 24(2023) TaxID=3068324 RepID=UPI0027DF7C52|nr:M23 family metallopeptidase [Stenotrophomonas sp. 24(2023)]WMJ70156.1 M23 family metallopeptidase [Stenotrophomonas sp. 24(2023)]
MPHLPLTCLLLPVLAAATAPGDWRQGWGLMQPPPGPVLNTPLPTPEGRPAAVALLKIEGSGERWQARVDNALAGPVQIELRPAPGLALPGLPVRSVLDGAGSLVVAHLPAPVSGQRLDLRLDAVPGDPAAQAQDVAYRVPFDGGRLQVSQPPQGRLSHDDEENRDAVDFALPEGTTVLAARSGTVMQVQAGFQGHGQRPADRQRANFIRVLHADGSMAVYAHLAPAGVQVRTGQQVEAGQPIGRSGNTGYSTAPHLHFVVQVNRGMGLRSVPVRIVSPQGELRFARTGDGTAAAGTGR